MLNDRSSKWICVDGRWFHSFPLQFAQMQKGTYDCRVRFRICRLCCFCRWGLGKAASDGWTDSCSFQGAAWPCIYFLNFFDPKIWKYFSMVYIHYFHFDHIKNWNWREAKYEIVLFIMALGFKSSFPIAQCGIAPLKWLCEIFASWLLHFSEISISWVCC